MRGGGRGVQERRGGSRPECGRATSSTHVPIESLCLKLIGDELEDHLYLAFLERFGERSWSWSRATELARGTFRWARNLEALFGFLRRLGSECATQR